MPVAVTFSASSSAREDCLRVMLSSYLNKLSTDWLTSIVDQSFTETLSLTISYLTAKRVSRFAISVFQRLSRKAKWSRSNVVLQLTWLLKSSLTKDMRASLLMCGVWVFYCLLCYAVQFPLKHRILKTCINLYLKEISLSHVIWRKMPRTWSEVWSNYNLKKDWLFHRFWVMLGSKRPTKTSLMKKRIMKIQQRTVLIKRSRTQKRRMVTRLVTQQMAAKMTTTII